MIKLWLCPLQQLIKSLNPQWLMLGGMIGPVSLWERLACGLAVYSLHSPCAPLLPVWGVDRARHTVPPPPGCLALPSPPHRHPLHARASGSAAAACRGPPDHRLAAPFPPRCLQRKYARRAARHHRKPGGRVGKFQLGSMLRP